MICETNFHRTCDGRDSLDRFCFSLRHLHAIKANKPHVDAIVRIEMPIIWLAGFRSTCDEAGMVSAKLGSPFDSVIPASSKVKFPKASDIMSP